MKSFKTLFCEETRCHEDEFVQKIFWRTLHLHAIPFVPFLGGFKSEYFAADRNVISCAGRATNVSQIRTEITDFFMEPENRRWLRKTASIRISTTRLKDLSKKYLPGADSRAPIGPTALD